MQIAADRAYNRGPFAQGEGQSDRQDPRPITELQPEKKGRKTYALGLEYQDTEPPSKKLTDFLMHAAIRASDPVAYRDYIQGELDKLIGIGEGLNIAKEQVKDSARVAWTALTDGTVAQFLAQPNAINDPLFKTVGNALDAMAKDPNATNHALEKLRVTLLAVNAQYNGLPNREKGRVIGETMFAMVNPEGSSKAGEAAVKLGDQLATQVENEIGLRSSAGAGGDWPVINERPSPDVVRQTDRMSCVSACGEMLTNGEFKQAELIMKLGVPCDMRELADALGPPWRGDGLPEEALDKLLQRGPWAAELRELNLAVQYRRLQIGHTVVVDGLDELGNIKICDPADGTRYEMTKENFLLHWSLMAVYR